MVTITPFLRTYRLFKEGREMEPYLYRVKESKYRIAISRLRASSHVLEIERGRYTRPKTPITERLCPFCNVVEDEQHFLLICKIYDQERNRMFSKISIKYENICAIESRSAFKFLLTTDYPLSPECIGQIYIYSLSKARNLGQIIGVDRAVYIADRTGGCQHDSPRYDQ